MRSRNCFLLVAVALVVAAPALYGQNADPSGHWDGSVEIPGRVVEIQIDVEKNGKGGFRGTFAQPEQRVKGLPISAIAVDGTSLAFIVKADASPASFAGEVSEDGENIAGQVSQFGYVFPFHLKWTGVAHFEPVPVNAAIARELEGVWNGTIDAQGVQNRVVVRLANQPDGTAAATIVSPDGSGIEIPIAVRQTAKHVAIDVPSIGASYDATMDDAGNEMTGIWSQSGVTIQLTLRHAAQ